LAEAPPQTPVAELTVLPDSIAGFKGPTSKRKQEREGEEK